MAKPALVLLLAVLATSCGRAPYGQKESGAAASLPNLEPRVGIVVPTASRTCIAIRNANLAPKTPVTLVVPTIPQSIAAAEISGPSSSNCPVTQEVQPDLTSYDLHVIGKAPTKLMPLIGVVGEPAGFTMNNIQVQANLNGDGTTQFFRACRGNNGIHLTIWNGVPLTGTRLWHGFYYEPSQAVVAPACSEKEQ